MSLSLRAMNCVADRRAVPTRRGYRLSLARRKRLGGAPTERRTIAAKALGLA